MGASLHRAHRGAASGTLVAALVALLGGGAAGDSPGGEGPPGGFAIRSPSFPHRGEIPRPHTCEGRDLSPPLSWSRPPDGTRSLALVVDDPDAPDPRAPRTRWVHWVVYNLPASATGLPEGAAEGGLPAGARHGTNGWRRAGYGGPCPPVGRHRYVHKLYALDVVLPDLGAPTRAELERAMEGHVLGRAELVGTYQKRGR